MGNISRVMESLRESKKEMLEIKNNVREMNNMSFLDLVVD